MEFRWVAALALWTVLSGPVLVDVVVSGNSGRQPQKVLVSQSDMNRAMSRSPSAGWDSQSAPSWGSSNHRR